MKIVELGLYILDEKYLNEYYIAEYPKNKENHFKKSQKNQKHVTS